RYSDFKNGPAKNRTPMVYAGSNGGFMHGFDASSNAFQWGQEKMAYIANFLFSSNIGEGLHYLTDPGYTHRYYNDLTPSLSDVYDGSDWQTVLISGVRGGGRGIFALDVTDPSLFDNPAGNADKIVMWEFTNADDPDLGYTYSRPQIGLSNASDGSWVAIFGNGYNNTGDGKAKLFILRIHQGTDGNWVANSDYLEIPAWVNAADGDNDPNTDSDGDGDNDDRNGLSSPALADLDGNGTIDRAYAGDLNGKMWAFDLSSSDPGQWKLDYGEPLFTTINNEPITAQPTLSRHPSIVSDGSNDPNVMVFFGSGQFLVDSDKVSTNTNYFYGVWDRGDLGGGVTSNDLQRQTYENGFVDNNGDPVRVLSRNPVNYIGGERGWYFDLPDPSGRERSITRPVVRGDVVFFNTYVPDDDPCAPKGYGYRMAVDLETGGSPDDPTFDVNEDGIVDENDRASNGAAVSTVVGLKQEGFLPEPVFIEDIAYTADTPSKVAKLKTIPKGRLSWQELIQ
ncbi:MAG: hypothetical protein JSU67_01755, partial [Gammaproteobacteria bacterium]